MTTTQQAPRRTDDELAGSRWTSRPALGQAVRAVVFFGPVIAGVLTSTLLVRMLVAPAGAWAIAWWIGLFAVSGGAVFGADRLFRHLTPLATLFSLTLVFPDQAPSRFKVVRRSNDVRKLAARRHLRRGGKQEVGEVSEQILALIAALDAHDKNTRGHSERTGVYADMLAREMNVPLGGRDRLRWAALLHDVGKLTVSADTLKDTGTPKEAEWDEIRRHPEEGARLAAPLMPWLGEWGLAIAEHHERFDGAGYPHGIAGEDISLAGRIVAVADAYDTMTAGRPYKKPLSPEAARAEIAEGAGTRYDPRVCRAMMQLSLGRRRRSIALLGWLGQLPFTLGFDRLGHAFVAAAQTAGSVAAAGVGTVALLISGVVSPAKAVEPTPGPQTAPLVSAAPERAAASEPAAATAPTEAPPAATQAPTAQVTQENPVPVASIVPELPVPVPSAPVAAPVAPAACSAATHTLKASKDAWISNDLDDGNHGGDDTLWVQSKHSDNKPADGGHNNRRALLAFQAPQAPAGCRVVSATLRLYSIHAHDGRTIDVLRAGSLWSEIGVLWANQPSSSGPSASAPSGLGWRTWNVTALVNAGSTAFVVRDRVEDSKGNDQRYVSREGAENTPQLVVKWGAK